MNSETQLSRPSKVGLAVTLLYSALALGLLSVIYQTIIMPAVIYRDGIAVSTLYVHIGGFLAILLYAFFIYKISRGRNWARIVYLIFFLIALIGVSITLLRGEAEGTLLSVIAAIQMLLQLIAMVLLFQKESSSWFKAVKQHKS